MSRQNERLLEELTVEQLRRTHIKESEVLHEIAAIAFSDISEVVEIIDTDDGQILKVKPLDEMSEDTRASIASITQTSAGISVKLYNKDNALEKLMRSLGLYKADNTQRHESALDGLTLDQKIAVVQMVEGFKNAS